MANRLIFGILIMLLLSATQLLAQMQPPPRMDNHSWQEMPHEENKVIRLYPNPAVDEITVRLNEPHTSGTNFSLHSIIGNTLETETRIVDEFEVKINVKDLQSGVYLLSVHNESTGLKGIYKFIKK